ncbi:MAG: DUF3179 domain-containing protein [Candidatus Thiodiazotropha weberae]|uniref:DUF3179 domain-containing protein n=1 Tax=Candidatus Thiodiazotropha endoloripes TaxID=1818881 RepID=A0A1E2UVM1_9GAMM|nr:DUF3179 domain-containing protein [Candidatus Thiodiazotropha endoloripes]MCG7900152.1 DUF3179 domain-containing protein [Candidatus Thiodiazotropha weberae]ODB98652.1 hypothetical protein A3196_14200 [Candidatus Thiodiazotropha endoloripes]
MLFTSVQSSAGALYKNGFDVTDAIIEVSEILPGGPPRDGIPAIDKPQFVHAKDADFLQPEDRILGVERNGVVKAYPINILNWHEIVNDHFKQEPIVITFCPLCGTGMAFEATVRGKPLKFGVSGLLYNSDVLLYDHASESLWSQIMKQSISGKHQGERLSHVPLQHTNWADWSDRYPGTLVLSDDTGFSRNYQRSPYQGYEKSRDLYFPVEFRAKGYHPKERVLGLEINDSYKAYPFIELSKTDGLIEENLAGQQLTVKFDIQHQTANAYDLSGNLLPSTTAFWFAWYAFHPQTEIFRATDREMK